MRFFVFVDTPYYPYVDDEIEADSIEDARAIAAARLRPGDPEVIYLAPADSIASVRLAGPKPEPQGLLKVVQDMNRYHADFLDFRNTAGGFSVRVEPGSMT